MVVCGKISGENKHRRGKREENMTEEMMKIVVVKPFEMPPNQFNFPFPCRQCAVWRLVLWLFGWFVGELDLRAFTVECCDPLQKRKEENVSCPRAIIALLVLLRFSAQ